MEITDADRPDPRTGREATETYAEGYARHHRETGNTLDYRVWDADLLLLDRLLDNYRLLDVGCATAGHLRLLKNHAHVIGIDFSARTIAKALELRAEFQIPRADFAVSLFETYKAPHPFEAIRLRGTFGAYQSWFLSLGAIDKTRSMLTAGGIAIASYYPTPNFVHAVKARLLPKTTLAITPRRFNDLWARRGFRFLLSLKEPMSTVTFWQKT